MADNLTNVKDWIIIFNNVITAICAVIALIYVNMWRQAKERDETLRREQLQEEKSLRREQLQEEQRLRREQLDEARKQAAKDANKIAGVLSGKYDEAANIFRTFKKNIEKLKGTFLLGKLSEFHVLSYMCQCHLDNKEIYKEVENLLGDVEECMKLFFEFRIQLASIQDKECPQHIKDEFSQEIIEMGQTILPLVSKTRQKVIKEVLKYFGDPNVSNDTNSLDECHTTKEFHDTFPYIPNLTYENGAMYLKLDTVISIDSCIETLEVSLMNGEIQQQVKQEIFNKAKNLLPRCEKKKKPFDSDPKVENLLYVIRLIMFQLVRDPKFSKEKAVSDFLKYVRSVVEVDDEAVATRECERVLDGLQTHLNYLGGAYILYLIEDENNLNYLRQLEEDLREFIKEMIQR